MAQAISAALQKTVEKCMLEVGRDGVVGEGRWAVVRFGYWFDLA